MAWDSSQPAVVYEEPVVSVAIRDGSLVMQLNESMLAAANWPIYLDPTWTLSASLGWGSSTFQDAVEDKGDHNIKIGRFADNFNDNINEGQWVVESGSVTFATGVMKLSTSTTVRLNLVGSNLWSDYRFAYKVRFTQAGGTAQAYFRYADANNHYYLDMSEVGDQLILKKKFGGILYTVATIPQQILTNTDYTAKLRITGSTGANLEVWWQGVLKWSGADNQGPSVPATGYVKFATNSVAKANIDDARVWSTALGTMTTSIRNAGAGYKPTQTKTVGTVDTFNQTHVRIRSSADNSAWGPWTNLKADTASGVFYKVPEQDQQRYYQLRVMLTSGTEGTPALSELTATEDNLPGTITPTATTGFEPRYPYVGGLVNGVSGNVWYSARDLSVQGRGFPIAFVRSYNSLRGSEPGPLGNGWTHAYAMKLVVNGDLTVTWNDADGSQHVFTPKGITGGYSPPRGLAMRLVKNLADGSFTLWVPDGGSQAYTPAGRLSAIRDKNGNALTVTYDGNGRLTTIADDSGKSLTVGYDASNRIQTMTDPGLSRQITYTYDGSSNLVSVKDAMNFYENYSYASGKMSAIVDPIGKRTSFVYDGSNRAKEIWLGLYQGGSVVWQFRQYLIAYTSTLVRTITNARGFATTLYLNNSFGNPTGLVGPSIGCACDNAGNSSAFVWDGEMNRIKTTDGRGNAWSYDFDHRSNPILRTDPGGNVSTTMWSEVNTPTQYVVLLASQTNFRNFTTSFAYDVKGNLIKVTDPKGNVSERFYDSLGFLNRSRDARGFDTWYEYNANRYLTKITDPLNRATQFGYDAAGRQTSVTTPLGFVTNTTYNANDWTTRITNPLGLFTSYEYNSRGDWTKVTDPNGNATTYTINVTNGAVQVVLDAMGNTTTNAYDLRGNLVLVRDANNHNTTYEYDAYDRLTKLTSPLAFQTTYRYDAAGNLIGRTDANGNGTTYKYDKLNRAFKILYPAGSVVTYAWDANGNPTSEVGFGYTKTMNYDELDRPTSVVMNYGTFSKTTNYGYDANSNRIGMQQDGEPAINYTYDAANRPTRRTDADGRATTFAYDKDSRRTSTAYPNAVWTNVTYDQAGRLRTLYSNKSGAQVIESFVYTYDKAGNALTRMDGANTTTYTYDKLGRLTREALPGGTATTYTYDAVGNRLTKTVGTLTTEYFHDDDDRLWKEEIPSLGFTLTYEYDNNGNLVREWDEFQALTRYEYDAENRLTKIVHPQGQTCVFTYTSLGERMTTSSYPCAATTYVGYDFHGSGGYEHVTAEYDSSGVRQARYTQGPGVDEPVGMLCDGSYYSYQSDALGSVTRLTDSSQTPVNTYRYDAWDRATTASETTSNPFRYTGREKSAGSALYYYRARTYDPDTGRFTGKDPAGMADGTNRYAYVGGSPLGRTDASGMRFSENDPFENLNPRGRGPTGPPGNSGQGNAYGHCGGGGSGTSSSTPRAAGWLPDKCHAIVIGIILGITSTVVFGFKTNVRALIGDALTSYLVPLMIAWGTGDWGGVAWMIIQLAATLLWSYIITQPWWAQIPLFGRINTIWLSLGLAGVFLAIDLVDFYASGCL